MQEYEQELVARVRALVPQCVTVLRDTLGKDPATASALAWDTALSILGEQDPAVRQFVRRNWVTTHAYGYFQAAINEYKAQPKEEC